MDRYAGKSFNMDRIKDGALIATKGAGYIKSNSNFQIIFSCILNGKHHLKFQVKARAGATAEYFSRSFMKYRFLTVIITGHTETDRQEQCINNMHLW